MNLPEQVCKIVGHDMEITESYNDPTNLCIKTKERCKRCDLSFERVTKYIQFYQGLYDPKELLFPSK